MAIEGGVRVEVCDGGRVRKDGVHVAGDGSRGSGTKTAEITRELGVRGMSSLAAVA